MNATTTRARSARPYDPRTARAAHTHRRMTELGLPQREHKTFASNVLDRAVESFKDMADAEHRLVVDACAVEVVLRRGVTRADLMDAAESEETRVFVRDADADDLFAAIRYAEARTLTLAEAAELGAAEARLSHIQRRSIETGTWPAPDHIWRPAQLRYTQLLRTAADHGAVVAAAARGGQG